MEWRLEGARGLMPWHYPLPRLLPGKVRFGLKEKQLLQNVSFVFNVEPPGLCVTKARLLLFLFPAEESGVGNTGESGGSMLDTL